MDFWTTLANGLVGLLSACIGAKYTLWLQSRNDLIKRIDDKTLLVAYKAIRCDSEGLYIPGYGRILSDNDANTNLDLKSKKAIAKDVLLGDKPRQKNVAFYFYDRTAGSSDVVQYAIGRKVPL